MKHVMKISTVAFHAIWGKKELNLQRMLDYIELAAGEGSNLVVFPEMALTGYDDKKEQPKAEKMQVLQAETVPGPSSQRIAEAARKFGLYVAFGLPERDRWAPGAVYNSACVCGPEGILGVYRKIHLAYPEPHWAIRGRDPFLFQTPWGPIGVGICYDSYCFPELMRYYAAKGCRAYLNLSAHAKCHGTALGNASLVSASIVDRIYVVTSNLAGKDLFNVFWGGASIIGPSMNFWEAEYYAGYPFTDPRAIQNRMYTATVDLSLANLQIFGKNPTLGGASDFRPALYKAWMEGCWRTRATRRSGSSSYPENLHVHPQSGALPSLGERRKSKRRDGGPEVSGPGKKTDSASAVPGLRRRCLFLFL